MEAMNQFSIQILEMSWLGEYNFENDLCAHGKVKVIIGDEIIAGNDITEDFTISSTALFLLRTLERNHTKENNEEEFLLPHCGHTFYYFGVMKEVLVMGCNIGIDWEVIHENGKVILKTESGNKTTIDFNIYKSIVLNFVDKVNEFYLESDTKILPEDNYDRNGYLEFWNEWRTRRQKWN
jgi:hypothetical protein